MKVKLLKKIRQRYDYYFFKDTNNIWDATQLRVLDKKLGSNIRFNNANEFIREVFSKIKTNSIIPNSYYNIVYDKHTTKENIRSFYRNKKKLSLQSRNLTIRQILDYKNVKSIKTQQPITQGHITASSVALGTSNTPVTVGNGSAGINSNASIVPTGIYSTVLTNNINYTI